MTPNDSTKDALIAAAKKVFADKGYDGATVKELAEAAGVNISLVSYHFQGKENLFRTCLQEFGEARLASTERLLKHAENLDEFKVRISLFVEEFFMETLKEPDLHVILHRDCGNLNNPIVQEVFQNTFMKVFQLLIEFFESAQKKKILSRDFDAHLTAMLFIGGMVHTTRLDPMHKHLFGTSIADQPHREKLIKNTVRLVLEGTVS